MRLRVDLSLIAVTLIWGATFVLVKQALGDVSTLLFLTIRFTVAALALALIFRKQFQTPQLRLSLCGGSKRRRTICSPGLSARHPVAPIVNSADSIGCAASSDVTSTRARASKSSQLVFADGLSRCDCEMICLRIGFIV